jgi:hypothetical protein
MRTRKTLERTRSKYRCCTRWLFLTCIWVQSIWGYMRSNKPPSFDLVTRRNPHSIKSSVVIDSQSLGCSFVVDDSTINKQDHKHTSLKWSCCSILRRLCTVVGARIARCDAKHTCGIGISVIILHQTRDFVNTELLKSAHCLHSMFVGIMWKNSYDWLFDFQPNKQNAIAHPLWKFAPSSTSGSLCQWTFPHPLWCESCLLHSRLLHRPSSLWSSLCAKPCPPRAMDWFVHFPKDLLHTHICSK